MSLTQIIKEITKKQLEYLEQYGVDIEGWFQSDDYEIILYKDPHLEEFTDGEVNYQIGFQRKGHDFTDEKQVMNKQSPDDVSYSDLRKLEPTIRKWVDKYQAIGVGSNNRDKSETYANIFDRLGFNVETIEMGQHGFEGQLFVYITR